MAISKRNRQRTNRQTSRQVEERHPLWGGPMLARDETLTFVMVNLFDFFMTYIILYYSHMPGSPLQQTIAERNPVAAYFINHWGPMKGMLGFKLTMVVFVCVITQAVAWRKEQMAKNVLNFGSLVVGAVVVYSLWLLVRSMG